MSPWVYGSHYVIIWPGPSRITVRHLMNRAARSCDCQAFLRTYGVTDTSAAVLQLFFDTRAFGNCESHGEVTLELKVTVCRAQLAERGGPATHAARATRLARIQSGTCAQISAKRSRSYNDAFMRTRARGLQVNKNMKRNSQPRRGRVDARSHLLRECLALAFAPRVAGLGWALVIGTARVTRVTVILYNKVRSIQSKGA